MKYDIFFKLAKEAGIEEAELYINKSSSLSFSLFHSEVDNYEASDSFSVQARGIYKGKMGAVAADTFSKEKAEYFVKQIITNASISENEDPVFIFKGSDKYHKISTFNKELPLIPIDTKMDNLYKLEAKIKSLDERIAEIEGVSYSESSTETILMNSHGLKLNQKRNYFFYDAAILVKDKEQAKSNYAAFLDNDYKKFDVDKLAEKVVKDAIKQLGGINVDTGEYKVVLASEVVKDLVNAYLSSAIAEEVQKHSSLFEGKLHERVASKLVTIEDRPIQKSIFATWFDDEGVATSNKPIIKNGILETYVYNLTTAAKDGVETTGNGIRGGSKMSTGLHFIQMKPGNKTTEELYKIVDNGVLITDVQGLHSGLNAQSGNFSLQSTGFVIKDGKVAEPIDLITLSGNLITMFKEVIAVGKENKTFISAISCPPIVIKSLKIGGK